MPLEEKAPERTAGKLKDLIENANKWAGLIAAAVALLTFASGNRLSSYVFIAIASFSLSVFLWRAIRRRALAAIAMGVIIAASIALIGVHGWEDYKRLKGILFRRAEPNEVLLIVAQFAQKGSRGFDPSTRIVDRLRNEMERSNTRNVRVERAPVINEESDALKIGHTHGAVSVIWGWYDDTGFTPHYTIVRRTKLSEAKLTEVDDSDPQFSLYLRQELPAQMSFLLFFTVGQLYYFDGKFDEALRAFDVAQTNLETGGTAKPIPDGSKNLYLFRGQALRGKGDFNGAIAAFSKTIDLDPKLAKGFNLRGVAYGQKGDFDQALTDFGKAIDVDARYAEAYINRGDAYFKKNDLNQAFADFSNAINLDPKLSLAYYNRGVVYSEKGSLEQAIADYTESIGLEPHNASAYNNRGNAYRMKGNLGQAFTDFNKALELNPKFGTAYLNRGIAYFDKGKLDLAIADYTKAIELDPKDDLAYNNRGNANRAKGNLDQALTDLNKATDLKPELGAAYKNRGLVYWRKGLKPQAIVEFGTYLRLSPNAPDSAEVQQWLRELKGQ